MDTKEDKVWSPYFTGVLSGLVLILSVLFTDKFFGASTTFVRSVGLIEKFFNANRVTAMDYFSKYVPEIDWQFMFVIGIFIGALLSSVFSESFRWQGVPDRWRRHFGPSPAKRGLVAFIGGAISIFGARLAGGCPSGQGLSGLIQLSVSGIISLICFFIGGIVVVRLVYRGR